MGKRILLCLSHAIEESDQLRLLTDLGYEVASIGGYIDPRHPHDPKRPALDIPFYPEIKAAVDALGTDDNLGAAQSEIPDAILEWLGDDGIIIFHHYLERLFGQWHAIRDWMNGSPERRVIWRSVGQSVEHNERLAAPFRADGLERVAYSPKEANIPGYSGHDALIRFYKDPDEWCGWRGEVSQVINFTQHLRQRDPYTNWRFWEEATRGLPAVAMGPGSEVIGGTGEQTLEQMKESLTSCRAYLYTGTQPASYTLGLIEAMMTGIPVVSIGPSWMQVFPYGPDLFEGHEITDIRSVNDVRMLRTGPTDNPDEARQFLKILLNEPEAAKAIGWHMRARAIDLFGKDKIGREWAAYLG